MQNAHFRTIIGQKRGKLCKTSHFAQLSAKNGENCGGGGIGLMLPIHLTKRLAIVPDVKFLVHSRGIFAGSESCLASTLSATLGISINLASNK